MNKNITALSLAACLTIAPIVHSADNNSNVVTDSYTAIGLLATQTTCKGKDINTIVVNVPGFRSRSSCEAFLIPNAHTKDFLGTDGEICRINYNFDGLCIAMQD